MSTSEYRESFNLAKVSRYTVSTSTELYASEADQLKDLGLTNESSPSLKNPKKSAGDGPEKYFMGMG